MKRLFFTVAVALGVFVSASAQDVGQWWVGGSVGFWSSKTKGTAQTLTTYKFLPEIGYAATENIGIGINLGYTHNETLEANWESSVVTYSKEKKDGFTVAPFVRFSFLKGDLGGLFVDATTGYTYSKVKGANYKVNQFEVGARPGVAVNVSDRISLIGKFGFIGYQYTKAGDAKTNSFGFDLDMSQMLLGACLKF